MAPGLGGFAVLWGLAACRIELIQRLAQVQARPTQALPRFKLPE